jgi:sialic acid synthase SpsE
MRPKEFAWMVDHCRAAAASVGSISYEVDDTSLRRSLWVVKDVAAGETFTHLNVRSARPELGLAVRHTGSVMGRVATQDIPAGTPLSWEHVHAATMKPEGVID